MWKRNRSSSGAVHSNAPSRSAMKPSTETLIEKISMASHRLSGADLSSRSPLVGLAARGRPLVVKRLARHCRPPGTRYVTVAPAPFCSTDVMPELSGLERAFFGPVSAADVDAWVADAV